MNKFLLILTLIIPLCSCIPVENFGAYWDKLGLDRRLAGDWRVAENPDQTVAHGDHIGEIEHIHFSDGAYKVYEDGDKPSDVLYPVKTLNAGIYQFIAAKTGFFTKNGFLMRYKLNGRTLELCDIQNNALEKFVTTTFPNASTFKRVENKGREFVIIPFFNDDVIPILSKIPDTKAYWSCDTKFRRVSK